MLVVYDFKTTFNNTGKLQDYLNDPHFDDKNHLNSDLIKNIHKTCHTQFKQIKKSFEEARCLKHLDKSFYIFSSAIAFMGVFFIKNHPSYLFMSIFMSVIGCFYRITKVKQESRDPQLERLINIANNSLTIISELNQTLISVIRSLSKSKNAEKRLINKFIPLKLELNQELIHFYSQLHAINNYICRHNQSTKTSSPSTKIK